MEVSKFYGKPNSRIRIDTNLGQSRKLGYSKTFLMVHSLMMMTQTKMLKTNVSILPFQPRSLLLLKQMMDVIHAGGTVPPLQFQRNFMVLLFLRHPKLFLLSHISRDSSMTIYYSIQPPKQTSISTNSNWKKA